MQLCELNTMKKNDTVDKKKEKIVAKVIDF